MRIEVITYLVMISHLAPQCFLQIIIIFYYDEVILGSSTSYNQQVISRQKSQQKYIQNRKESKVSVTKIVLYNILSSSEPKQ